MPTGIDTFPPVQRATAAVSGGPAWAERDGNRHAGVLFDRRRLLGGAALAGLAAAGGGPAWAAAVPPETGAAEESIVNVCNFGARGDGRRDNTGAFQKALDAVSAKGGGIVNVPTGNYLFKGHLVLPAQTTLQGVYRAPEAFVRHTGTVLWPTEGHGKADGPAFLTQRGPNVTLRGLAIYYPRQDAKAEEPAPYPWTIRGTTDNLTVLDVALTNPYQGLNLELAGRHYIARVYGQPLLTGLYADQIYDIGRIENIHFWPFWVNWHAPLCRWISRHGTGLRFARSDWEYVFNTFVLGYNVGYHFTKSAHGACNGNFVGLGADASARTAILVEHADPYGLLITNGEFVADQRPDSVGIIVEPSNQGVVCLQNCAFWGPSQHIATLRGTGSASFLGCTFCSWDKHQRGAAAFLLDGAATSISNCVFNHLGSGHVAAQITPRCLSAVITGNTMRAAEFTVKRPAGLSTRRFHIAGNVATED